jgi:hypothetical protein
MITQKKMPLRENGGVMNSNSRNGKPQGQSPRAQRLSPELAEFMHMLTALEDRFSEETAAVAAN